MQRRLSSFITQALAFAVLLVLSSALAFGQAETGNVTGIITDPSGAVVPGAKVTLTNKGTGFVRTEVSHSDGTYTVTNLSPGDYLITIEAVGFSSYSREVDVTVGGHLTSDAKLPLASQTAVVEVSSEAGAQVNTQDQSLSTVVNSTQIEDLPSLTRNPYDFVALGGNISSDPNGSTGANGVGVSFNGQRSASTSILLDGGENVDIFSASVGQQVPLDSVQEYRVTTSDFTADIGRAGGGVVNVVTKAGTNTFHGSLYEYNRVSALASNTFDESANNFLARQSGTARLPHDRFNRNQFGYSLGGPIFKNKVFFFSNTEWTRIRSLGSQDAFIPTAAFIGTTAPNTQAFFAQFGKVRANAVPTGVFATDPTTGAVITSGGAPVFEEVRYAIPSDAGAGAPENAYSTVNRLDFNITDRTQIFGRYALLSDNFFPGTNASSAYVGYDTGSTDFNQNFLANITHLFSANVVSATKLTFNRFNNLQPLGTAPIGPGLYLNRANTASTINGKDVILPGYLPTSPGNAIPFGGPQNLYEILQDISIVKGAHTFKFGGQYLQARDNRIFGAFETSVAQLGKATFTDGIAGLVAGNVFSFQGAINPQGAFPCFRDPNTGAVLPTAACTLTLPVGSPSFARNNTFNDGAAYAQDSWKTTPRLTLNLGVRWEYYGVQHNSNPNIESNFYFGSGGSFFDNVRNGLVQTTPNAPGKQLYKQRFGNFAPRVGFAYDVFGTGKTSIRGGYGIGYERNFGNVTFNVIQNPPAYGVVSLIAGKDVPVIPITNSNAGPLAGSGTTVLFPRVSLRAVNPRLDVSYAQSYSLALEHEVAPNTIIALEYSGSRGIHQYSISNFNKPGFGAVYEGDGGAYAGGAPNPGTNPFSRLQTQYSNINFRGSNGDSYYNGLNVRAQTNNFEHLGLQLTANYTYSHAIDNLSSTFSQSGNNFNLGYLDPFNPGLDRGSADFDTRHRVAVSALYNPTFLAFKNRSKLVQNLFGGFEFAPIFVARTGTPYTIYDCTNAVTSCPRILAVPGLGNGGSSVAIPGVANLYNYLSLPAAAANTYVDPITGSPDIPTCTGPQGQGCVLPTPGIGRNHFKSPPNYFLNMGVYKNFRLTERVKLQLRGEAYNFTNHHNFYVVAQNADISAGNFIQTKKGSPGGTATAADERRNVQLAIRLEF